MIFLVKNKMSSRGRGAIKSRTIKKSLLKKGESIVPRYKNTSLKKDIYSIARHVGIKYVFKDFLDEIFSILENYLRKIIKRVLVYTKYANRNVVTSMDILYALKKDGVMIYGFGG